MSDLQQYKCPCCGGGIQFDSTIQKLKCPYCETEFDIEALNAIKTEAETDADSGELTWQTPHWHLQNVHTATTPLL